MKLNEIFSNTTQQAHKQAPDEFISDLLFFMTHSPEFSRKYLYPTKIKCSQLYRKNSKIPLKMLVPIVKIAHKMYSDKYDQSIQKTKVTSDILKDICKQLHSLILRSIKDDLTNNDET
jgi:hypothetical protein